MTHFQSDIWMSVKMANFLYVSSADGAHLHVYEYCLLSEVRQPCLLVKLWYIPVIFTGLHAGLRVDACICDHSQRQVA